MSTQRNDHIIIGIDDDLFEIEQMRVKQSLMKKHKVIKALLLALLAFTAGFALISTTDIFKSAQTANRKLQERTGPAPIQCSVGVGDADNDEKRRLRPTTAEASEYADLEYDETPPADLQPATISDIIEDADGPCTFIINPCGEFHTCQWTTWRKFKGSCKIKRSYPCNHDHQCAKGTKCEPTKSYNGLATGYCI